MDVDAKPRLTELAHGGGCGCKLSPAVLRDILARMPLAAAAPGLLVGAETADDAAVYRLNEDQALIATTDFFTPIVDDPFDFGRIAAANALSDIYAMGGRPVLALAVLGMPVGRIEAHDIGQILAGGAVVCASVGAPVAGGHSIDSAEPIYGLVALGLVHPDRVLRNCSARAGDRLILTKGLGVGVFSAALKQGVLDDDGYRALIAATTQVNTVGAELAGQAGVHAMTDVTGFGLLGHALEMCRGSRLRARLRLAAIPTLPGASALAARGVRTGAALRNWDSYGRDVDLPPDAGWRRDLLCDPQTSGGLLIAVAADACDAVLRCVRDAGFVQAQVVGALAEGEPGIEVCN